MELIVGSTGGTLHLKDEDIKLDIPPGAIEEGKTVKISLENILEETDMPVSHPLESIISPIVKCGPEGTIFHKPCLLSFPHDAVNEEFWEFSLLFKECFQDEWKEKPEIDEKDIRFTLKDGQLCIYLNHFCCHGFMGRIRNVFHAKKSIKLGVFGKMLVNEYKIRVKFWKSGKYRKVEEETSNQGENLLESVTVIHSLYKNMEISVEIPNQEWQVDGENIKIIPAEYLWCKRPSKTFCLKRNISTNVLKAKVSLSQDSNDIPEVEVNCDIEVLVSIPCMLYCKQVD
ncbi:netrin receptor UNC5B-a-like [Antedon mediterranea]|uniref:netrin receptor UNC5B-a-like n=1 Tax=Antedon mediterranea TaxID=105859 RepID=UPI003AF594C4